jgi:hypothetical protein
MSIFRLAAITAAALGLTACAMTPLPPPTATMDNVQAVRAANIAPVKVGEFTPAPGRPTEMDHSVSVRAGVQDAPNGSFARFLGDTLAAQLKGAGKLDPNSTLVISGLVTDTHVDSAMPSAHAALAAKFTLSRDGKVVFEKTLQVQSTWDSAFLGAVAIPDAFNHYAELFSKLVGVLLSDPEFRAAARQS